MACLDTLAILVLLEQRETRAQLDHRDHLVFLDLVE